MLTRPFTRLVVAFGVRKITQRRLVEEVVTGTLLLIPFGLLVGLITSRICTKIRFSRIRSDVWTTLVVFLIGDVLMEWLLPSLGCLPVPATDDSHGGTVSGSEHDDDVMVEEYVSSIFRSVGEDSEQSSSFFRQDEYHYTFTWLLQSYGLYCPPDFANSDSLLTPDATAILFSIRLIFLCIGVHIGESIGCFVALTGGIATGKSTAASMFVDYHYNHPESEDDLDPDENESDHGNTAATTNINTNTNSSSNNNNKSARNRRHKSNHNKKRGGSSTSNDTSRDNDFEDDELMKYARDEDSREGQGVTGLIGDIFGNWTRSVLSAFAAFALTDDGSGVGVYNEGTVQLICADSIAHSILLPPEALADQQRLSALSDSVDNAGEGRDDDDADAQSDDGVVDSGEEGDNDYDTAGNKSYARSSSGASDDQKTITEIVLPSDSVYHQIRQAFEEKDILNPNTGLIDRLKLGAIIFNDREERKKLNKITHPRILLVLLKNLVRSVFFGFADITMGDLPLLFESGKLSWLFGVSICVVTSEETQLARLIARNPELPKEECQARIDSQLPLSKKIERADIVIDNNGDLEQLREQVEDARRDVMGRLYGIGMSLLQMLLLIGGSTSIAVSSKFYTHWQQ